MSQPLSFSQKLTEEGVHLIGDFSGQTALCQVGRDFAELVHKMNLPLQVLDLPLSPSRMKKGGIIDMSEVDYLKPKSDLSIINWNADVNTLLAQQLPRELFEERRIIGIWYWETEILPESFLKGYDLVDEVWVTSKFIAESLSKNAPVPIRHFPHLLRPATPPEKLDLPKFLCNDRFVFLFCFDFRSVAKRKNPHGVCEAFIKAFPKSSSDGPICIIKSIGAQSDHGLEAAELRWTYRARKDIVFIDGWLTPESRDSLMARANCYISLHRAEGLGLTLMESMSLGKPCIATAYSGNMEFMTDENSWLIPFIKEPVGNGAWPYPPDHLWASPDLNAAAAAMMEVYSNPELAAKKGRIAQKVILQNHGFEAVSNYVAKLLDETIQVKPRKKSGLNDKNGPGETSNNKDVSTSGRTRAYKLLRESQALGKKIRSRTKTMKSWRLPSEVTECMRAMLDTINLQQKAQLETLHEIGELKARLKNYHGATLDGLVRDKVLTERIITSIIDDASPGVPID